MKKINVEVETDELYPFHRIDRCDDKDYVEGYGVERLADEDLYNKYKKAEEEYWSAKDRLLDSLEELPQENEEYEKGGNDE